MEQDELDIHSSHRRQFLSDRSIVLPALDRHCSTRACPRSLLLSPFYLANGCTQLTHLVDAFVLAQTSRNIKKRGGWDVWWTGLQGFSASRHRHRLGNSSGIGGLLPFNPAVHMSDA